MKIVVIGGGFIGRLVQYALPKARVLDAAPKPNRATQALANRIGPQYLWEPIPGLQSHSFEVTNLVDGAPPNDQSILAYKKKIGKENDGGDWELQFQHKMTGWNSLLPATEVEYDSVVQMVDPTGQCVGLADGSIVYYDHLVNTIPLPAFLGKMLVGPEFQGSFRQDPIFMHVQTKCMPEIGMTLNYLSNEQDPFYRVTSFNNERYHESLSEIPVEACERDVNSYNMAIRPGKIHPHPESETIVAMLRVYNIHCFGRFGTWQPDELAHVSWKNIVEWRGEL